jgi:proteic killer suppression protein
LIRSFRNKGLKELFETGRSRRVPPSLQTRISRRLDRMNTAPSLSDLNIPGFNFHPLRGKARRYAVHVNGPWRLTFGWDGTDVTEVDLEQYH